MNADSRKRSTAFSIILYLLLITYLIGAFFLFISWRSMEGFATLAWQRDTMPFYALVALLGAASVFGILKWRRVGVYGLVAAWVITGVLNLAFPREISYTTVAFAIFLVIAFFMLLLPVWKDMR